MGSNKGNVTVTDKDGTVMEYSISQYSIMQKQLNSIHDHIYIGMQLVHTYGFSECFGRDRKKVI
jgi:hypothetical protein